MEVATVRPYTKPLQPALRSNTAALCAPVLRCTCAAVLGITVSGVQVATTSRSRSCASVPAAASARFPATVARSLPGTCETLRSLMPLRVLIHSSEVSITVAIWSLVKTVGGRHFPQPVMAAYFDNFFARVCGLCSFQVILTQPLAESVQSAARAGLELRSVAIRWR